MSYGFSIIKDAEGIRLEEVSEGALQHIPDGKFTITGHHVTGAPGWSQTEVIGVNLAQGDKYVVSATGTCSITPVKQE